MRKKRWREPSDRPGGGPSNVGRQPTSPLTGIPRPTPIRLPTIRPHHGASESVTNDLMGEQRTAEHGAVDEVMVDSKMVRTDVSTSPLAPLERRREVVTSDQMPGRIGHRRQTHRAGDGMCHTKSRSNGSRHGTRSRMR